MNYKWIGAVMIIGSCLGFGISLALNRVQEMRLLKALSVILDDIVSELSYRLTPLPELVKRSARGAPKGLAAVFSQFAEHLTRQLLPDAASCMESAISEADCTFPHVNAVLLALGHSLGRYDLAGQLRSLSSVQALCKEELEKLKNDSASQLRSYRVLGLCAGCALVIFLI